MNRLCLAPKNLVFVTNLCFDILASRFSYHFVSRARSFSPSWYTNGSDIAPMMQARPPGILPPLPPGPPPSHMQPPFPYMGHTPPRGPLPPLPPGPPPPHIQQHDGRPGPAPYLPPPPSFQGPALTSGGAPQRGHDSNRGRRRRGGRNRKQGPVLGGDQMSDERVMAQWLQEEAGSDSDGRGMRYWANGSPLVGE